MQRRYLPGGEGLETELMMKQLGHQQEHHQDLNQFNSNHRNQEDEDQEPRYATQSLIRTEDSQCLLNISPQQQTIISPDRNGIIRLPDIQHSPKEIFIPRFHTRILDL